MNRLRKTVLFVAVGLFVAWLVAHWGRTVGNDDGLVRLVLGGVLSLCILVRPKPKGEAPPRRSGVLAAVGVVGMLCAVIGLVVPIHNLEWLGLVLILYACFCWALPTRFARDVFLSLFLLYWVHPLPGQLLVKLQFGMQWLSVQGAEWLLHAANVRVWANEFILHTGLRAYGVPEACSGMRTAVTVLLCALGTGVLFRFRWYETVAFLVLGLVQVLVLNVVRIAGMVYWGAGMSTEWANLFLHDTLGVFLLAAIVLIQVEAAWWRLASTKRRRIREGTGTGELERPDRARRLPRIWVLTLRWGGAVLGVVLLISLVALAFYKRRPEHRVAMVAGVIEGFMAGDLALAQEAVEAALTLTPGSRDLLAKRARISYGRADYAAALRQLDQLPGGLNVTETVLKSWSLMELDRPEEAAAIVEALPESQRTLPGVAVIRAQYAALKGETDEVVRNVKLASRWAPALGRVRRLFPYLAGRRQWQAIVEADSPNIPYQEARQAAIVAHAYLVLNDTAGAATTMKNALAVWPDDQIFLSELFSLAMRLPDSEWEDLFVSHLASNLTKLSADRLAPQLEKAFQLSRPDLAWQVYTRLSALDPRDPTLFLAAARFGPSWLTFRRHYLGLSTENVRELIDLTPLYLQTAMMPPFRSFWSRVPLIKQFAAGDSEALSRDYLAMCRAELERRASQGTLNRRTESVLPLVLAMSGHYDEAHASLTGLEAKYPDRRGEFLFLHADFFSQEGRWEECYETVREHNAQTELPSMPVALMMLNALMNMNLGVCAMAVVEEGRANFPGALEFDGAAAAVWDAFGFKEQALFILGQNESGRRSGTMVQLLYETGRHSEAEKLSRATGFPIKRDPLAEKDALVPTPAELSISRRWPAPLNDAQMDREAARVEAALPEISSPFLRQLGSLMVAWYRAHGAPSASDPSVWLQIGRDGPEGAAALQRLTTLLARQRHYELAAEAAAGAGERLPESAVLCRIRLALSEGDAELTRDAVARFPYDPEIWLASLVVRMRDEGPGAWCVAEIKSAVDSRQFPVGTIVRAGDLALRKGVADAAAIAARDAISRGQGLLASYVLGLRCAMAKGDRGWALSCALAGAEHAADPGPFYKTIVRLKATEDKTDGDMITALEYLQKRFPKEDQWQNSLGFAYFQKGDAKRALSILNPMIERDMKGMRVQSLMLAAEAARLDGNGAQAIRILEAAYAMYPDKVGVLNNLVYNLAQNEGTAARAKELLPALLKMDSDSFAVLDTAALVYLKNGDLEKAGQSMARALRTRKEGDYLALEAPLNAARLLLEEGRYRQAREKVEEVRRDPKCSGFVDQMAVELLRRIGEGESKTRP